MSKEKKRKALSYMGILFVYATACIFFLGDAYMGWASKAHLSSIYTEHVLMQSKETFAENELNSDASEISTNDLMQLNRIPSNEGDVLNTDVIGALHAPSISFKVPIYNGESTQQLLYGAVLLKEGDRLLGRNVVLGGHILKKKELLLTPFLQIKNGETIYVTDKQMIRQYEVEKRVHFNSKTAYVSLPEEHATLSVVIPHPENDEERVVIQARFIAQEESTPALLGEYASTFGFD